jgi:hypothetical protein
LTSDTSDKSYLGSFAISSVEVYVSSIRSKVGVDQRLRLGVVGGGGGGHFFVMCFFGDLETCT